MSKIIETNILIEASPNRVWNVLTDFQQMRRWNPFITNISGALNPGGQLSVRITPPGKSSMVFKPTVLVVKPGVELRWLGQLLFSGVFDGEHYFLLQQQGPNQTRFVQGEKFSGLLLAARSALSATETGFTAMNKALKAEAEKV